MLHQEEEEAVEGEEEAEGESGAEDGPARCLHRQHHRLILVFLIFSQEAAGYDQTQLRTLMSQYNYQLLFSCPHGSVIMFF